MVAWSRVGTVNGHEGANEMCVKISNIDSVSLKGSTFYFMIRGKIFLSLSLNMSK